MQKSLSSSSSSNSKSIVVNNIQYTSDELHNALIFRKTENNSEGILIGITNGKIKKFKNGEKYLKLYSFIGPKNVILEEEISKIIPFSNSDLVYKSLLNNLIKAPGTLNKLPPINKSQIHVPKPPENRPAEGSRRSKRHAEKLQSAAPPLEPPGEGSRSRRKVEALPTNTEKKDRSRRRVEITVEQLREHLERKFQGFTSIDDIFKYIKDRFTKDDLTRFLLKQVKADLELML